MLLIPKEVFMNKCDYIPILLYSDFDKKKGHSATVSVDKFRQEIRFLKRYGYSFVSLNEIVNAQKTNIKLEKAVCIVFAGGYESQVDVVFSVLNEERVHADIFIPTSLVGKDNYPGLDSFKPHFSWDDANQMYKSGLVDVYGSWHVFDQGKDYKTEISNKIKMICQNIESCNEQIAFFINIDKDSDVVDSALRSLDITHNIVSYYKVTPENLRSDVLPFITVHQETNVLDLIDLFDTYFNDIYSKVYITTHKKEKSAFPKAGYDSVILPVDVHPRVKSTLRHAFPLSVIGAHRKDKADMIVLNDYIDVVFRPWYHYFDFDNHLYTSWPELESCRLDRCFINSSGLSITNIVLHSLCAGYYADLWLDEYYIPGKSGYNKKHLSHAVMIYGFDKTKNVFLGISYDDKGHYRVFEIIPDDICKACSTEYFMSLQLIKSNLKQPANYNEEIILSKLLRYITSEYAFDNTKYNKYDEHQYVNYAASLKYLEYLEETIEKEKSIYIVALYNFLEHKKCMSWRLNYIVSRRNINTNIFSRYEQETYETAEKILNLALIYIKTKNNKIVPRMIQLIEHMNVLEKDMITQLLD